MRPLFHCNRIDDWADDVQDFCEVASSFHAVEELVWWLYIFSREDLRKKELRDLVGCRQGRERETRARHLPGNLRRRRLGVGVERFLKNGWVNFALRERRREQRAGIREPKEKESAYSPVCERVGKYYIKREGLANLLCCF